MANEPRTLAPVKRTSNGLVEALFDTIDRLNRKEIDAEHARAISHTAKTIVNVANLEMEWRKFNQETTHEPLKSLVIDSSSET